MKPHEFALLSDNDALEIKLPEYVKDNYDKLRVEVNNRNDSAFINNVHKTTLVEDYSPVDFSWRELFMKLSFEQVLEYFPQHQDFKLFYKYINDVGPFIQCLRIKILDKTHFKSNHYWLMTLVGRMKNLKVIKFHKDSLTVFGVDGFRFLQKGFKYFQDNGGSLSKIQFNALLGSSSDEYFP
jgi:hypothetical protein